jgi:UDP-4-amino-4,6-dideoxy-N-acetyl-beta-L-altrosamine transaminase
MIRYSEQNIDHKDILNVIKTLKSNLITTGPQIPKFEKNLSKKVHSKYCVVFNSATSALHSACLALGLKKNDWLWTSANSFVASANCGIYCGAKIDFIDIELETFNIDLQKLEIKLQKAKKKKLLPKIIIPVVFAGQSYDRDTLIILAKKYKFKILEDASHALGSKYKNKNVGSYKDIISVFSFHPVKMITTGEGGSAHTSSKKYYDIMKSISSHGIIRRKKNLNQGINHLLYEQKYLGFNYRLTDIQAALGISQLKKLDLFLKKRRSIVNIYNQHLDNKNLILPIEKKYSKSSFHLYVVLVLDKKKKIRNDLIHFLKQNKIFTNIHYKPIHLQPYFKKLGFKKGDFKNAEKYYERAISLPIHPNLKKKEVMMIIKKINNFFKKKN